MSHKIFPRTHTGDQISIEFNYKPEADAFEQALRAINAAVGNPKGWELIPEGKAFAGAMRLNDGVLFVTTLQQEMAEKMAHEIVKITGLIVANFWPNGGNVLIRHLTESEKDRYKEAE